MKRGELLHLANASLLFLCVSMYLGTGWSLILFTFPIAPQLTVDNYYLQFVPQVQAATRFFTGMTMVMLLSAVVLAWRERRSALRWYPLMVLLAVVVATLLTRIFIFPYNDEMAAGISSPERLAEVLGAWMRMNRVRVGLWTVQWLSMLGYFVHRVLRAEHPVGARSPRFGLSLPPRREVHA
ncbi:DUF1772 domain-containing protein [Corallococcus sp. CA047B]|uniref:DUF1772 domain-containing protein n=1 Tax=Corallococcus sp. CA047B TaxID=2316729 RepID=UPI000EA1CB85|nr:DUF1772 domain-containing protein [Corallococcus sp. CA047B]RKH16601.1 DUF1772 domain-containing protein [Corallococcus sp. CA047B]